MERDKSIRIRFAIVTNPFPKDYRKNIIANYSKVSYYYAVKRVGIDFRQISIDVLHV